MDREKFRLVSKRLILRCARIEDAAFFYALMNSPGWLEGIGDRGIKDLQMSEDNIKNSMFKNYTNQDFGMYVVALINKPDVPLGSCGLIKRPELDDVDIGFSFLAKAGGQGYAVEAAQAVLDHGREALNIDPIVAITSLKNWRSARVLEAIGLSFQKEIRFGESEEVVRLFR